MNPKLMVYREIRGEYELVGALATSSKGATFSYDSSFLANNPQAISRCFPLSRETFEVETTRAFFDGLLSEGPLRRTLSEAFHVGENDYRELLSRLNNESAGALVFAEEGINPADNRHYKPLSFTALASFASAPRAEALEMTAASRLSLAGAQAKVGLHHQGESMLDGWMLPCGSAPSTYIVKAVDGTFPGQTINEALCMRTAFNLGFDVADCELIPVENAEPLLAVKRFDRANIPDDAAGFPRRVHQEDFCQALGWPSSSKYEKTDGNYLSHGAYLVNSESSNPFGDRQMFFSRILFDWAIGNCDNHLKNHSILWSADWSTKYLSPLYDITCTTIYPTLDLEMGVSLCPSRRIDKVTLDDIFAAAKAAGVPPSIAKSELASLGADFLHALRRAEKTLLDEGFHQATTFAAHIEEGFSRRHEALNVIR